MTGAVVGQTLLVVACCLAGGSAIAALVGAGRLGSTDTYLLRGAAGALWAAVAVLAAAILRLDTSFAYVADQTRPDVSLPIRFSALWSGAEGSLLLFGAIVVSATLVAHRHGPRWQRCGIGTVALGFGLASRYGADPFEQLDLPPLAGVGMAPILEHYAMVIHPPMLYVGMCLSLTPALIRNRQRAHLWGLASLAILTVSLGFGSAWAYVELGWGGWWAWDPIENVALIVWILLVAALHWRPLDTAELRGSGVVSVSILWALCWPAVLGGAALTRTSLRTSVHAFSDAEGLAVWLWPMAIIAAVGAMARVWEDRPKRPGPLLLRLPQSTLLVAAVIIAAGTYRPFIGGDGTAGWFYSRTLFPVAIIGLVLIGALPLWHSERSDDGGTSGPLGGFPVRASLRFGMPGAAAMLAVIVVAGWRQWWQLMLAATLGWAGALVVSSGRANMARLAGHLGILFLLFGALAGTASTETTVRLQPGEAVQVAGHTVELVSTEVISDDPLQAQATIRVDGAYELTPSVSVFPERNLRLPEVSTRTRPWLDSQAVLRDVDAEAGTLATMLFRPWNQLVWWGVALIALAAVCAALPGRHRPTDPDSVDPDHVENERTRPHPQRDGAGS